MNRKMYWGVAILILFIGSAAVFIIQHELADHKQLAIESDDLEELVNRIEEGKNVKDNPRSDAPVPNLNPITEVSDETNEQTSKTETQPQPTETPLENATAKDVPVSPFGYGPYPDVPNDYRAAKGNPIWEHQKWPDGIALPEGAELLHRVLIKAWKEGNRDWVGASHENGKVRINYPNTLYIWYGKPYEDEDGTIIRPIRRAKGDPNARLTPDEMRRGIISSGVRILDGETEAIDVSEYLNLPTE